VETALARASLHDARLFQQVVLRVTPFKFLDKITKAVFIRNKSKRRRIKKIKRQINEHKI
jgi:hypothetical protein